MQIRPLLLIAALAAPFAAAAGVSHSAASPLLQQVEKKVITSSDQLPRRVYRIGKLPSELVEAPKAELEPVLDQLDRDVANDLETLDIRDRSARAGMLNARAQVAIQRGDYKAAQGFIRQVREEQEKAAEKMTSGTALEKVLDARIHGGSMEEQRAYFREAIGKAYGAMPWGVVSENLKQAKASFELMSKDVSVGAMKSSLDPAARNLNLTVPASFVLAIASVRNTFDHMLPFRDDAVAVLQQIVDRNQVAKADVWSQRLVVLPPSAHAKPVVVGIWDSGTDVALFHPGPVKGIAFDEDFNHVDALVRPMGPAEPRMGILKQYMKGAMDMRAAIDSADARAFKQRIASLKRDEVKQFSEDIAAISMWAHGTHVAGIAVDGNPFAEVTAVAMHWSSRTEPQKPSEERSRRTAAAYKEAVESFRKAGARVVNMSWRYAPSFYESALAYHNVGATPQERKDIANRLFAIEKTALEEAIAGAPEILFVAGSGNEDNNADFSQYIPAGLELPNLITAGAVDQSGTETSFSTFGRTVKVHANGFEISSYVPGGEKVKLSGTSMASPQVANLAAKLFALKPELTVAQAKELIIKGADHNGRVNLINPRKTLELAGVDL
ncbi:MAG: S8 family serine peptidase [Betaproteobacteria bacterium]